eukprot:20185-Heterococcus_DN1.PRE.2
MLRRLTNDTAQRCSVTTTQNNAPCVLTHEDSIVASAKQYAPQLRPQLCWERSAKPCTQAVTLYITICDTVRTMLEEFSAYRVVCEQSYNLHI